MTKGPNDSVPALTALRVKLRTNASFLTIRALKTNYHYSNDKHELTLLSGVLYIKLVARDTVGRISGQLEPSRGWPRLQDQPPHLPICVSVPAFDRILRPASQRNLMQDGCNDASP